MTGSGEPDGGLRDHGTGAPDHGMQVFAAFAELVKLIHQMVTRRAVPNRLRQRWQVPLLCLVTDPQMASPLAQLAQAFATDDRRVPHVRIDASTTGVPADAAVRELLSRAYLGLATGTFGADPLVFRHFALADALLRVDLTGVPTNQRRRELARRLRRELGSREPTRANSAAPVLGGWVGLVLWLAITTLPGLTLWLLTKGWLFGAGRPFRWFLSQRYLAPKLAAGSFFTFATRLTVGARDAEDPRQIDLLLTHAFLQDLRVAYRRRPWRLGPWRRTAYPVILLDNAAPDNAGYQLVQLINEIRDETGLTDPLLVIANSHQVPPDGLPVTDRAVAGRVVPLDGVRSAYAAWLEDLPRARRARRDDTWFLPVKIPLADLGPYRRWLPKIRPARAPLLARPVVLGTLALLVVVGAAIWQVPQLVERYRTDCDWPPTGSPGLIRTVVRDGQCVGYADNAAQLFSRDETLLAIQKTIFEQNRQAEAARRDRPSQPFATLVYLGSLTKPDAIVGEETFAGEREELQGMAVAQARAYEEAKADRASPLLRIVIANAGPEMEYSAEVVSMLADLAADDPTFLGVVGLVESRTSVRTAIRQLSEANLPVIAPTLSADGIAEGSSRYLQISAPNADEADFVHRHVTQVLRKPRLFNFFTFGSMPQQRGETEDLYVGTLREALRDEFGDDYEESYWQGDVDLSSVCADRFTDGVVFFGGRYGDFGAFAAALAGTCSGRMPILIADDSVNRYMANVDLRGSAPENLPVAYVAKGALAYCDQLAQATDTERIFFRDDVRRVLGLCMSDSQIGERVGLAYDATRLLLKAVRELASGFRPQDGQPWRAERINRTVVHATIRQFANPYRGVTGLIRFDLNGIAEGKRLTMLCARNIKRAFQPGYVPVEIDRHVAQEAEEFATYGPPATLARRPCTATTA